jgi:hypothetical protein
VKQKEPPTFKPTEILGVLDREGFLDKLNRLRDLPGSTFKLTPGGALVDGFRLRKTDVSPAAQLRLYVDEWLDTGVDTKEGEDPSARDLTKAPNACAAVRRFASKEPLRLEPVNNGLRLRFPSVQRGPFLVPPEPLIDMADRLFSLFLLCDWRARLAKCRRVGCGRYFELKQWNRLYKKGTLCGKCARARSLESAVRATSEVREAAGRELYRLASRRFGKRLLKTKDWHRDRQFRTTIVDFLNAQIEGADSLKTVYPHGITGKWLSRSNNRNGIEKAARGEAHAES